MTLLTWSGPFPDGMPWVPHTVRPAPTMEFADCTNCICRLGDHASFTHCKARFSGPSALLDFLPLVRTGTGWYRTVGAWRTFQTDTCRRKSPTPEAIAFARDSAAQLRTPSAAFSPPSKANGLAHYPFTIALCSTKSPIVSSRLRLVSFH